LLSDEEIESKVHDAVIEETITNKSGRRTRVRITINEIGEGFITKKHLSKNVQLPDGTPLSVEIKKESKHPKSTERWLVSKLISINGELYTPPEPEPKQEKPKPKPKKIKPEKKIKKPRKQKLAGQSKTHQIDDERSIISKPGLYTAVPFSILTSDLSISLFSNIIEQDGPILVTLFRDTMHKKMGENELNPKGIMEQRKVNFLEQLQSMFPMFSVKSFDWPDNYRSSFDNYRSSHPYVSHHCRAAAIVHKMESEVTEEKYKNALFDAVHDQTLKLSKNKWTIVGDETGTLDEFNSESSNVKSTMCWLAIPPGTNLPALPPTFHCSGKPAVPDYVKAIKSLCKLEGILMFTFAFEQGEIIEDTTKIGEAAHLNFWQDTLPLVLQKVSEHCPEKVGVDIFIEQVFQLESGISLIEPIIQRKKWEKFRFEQLWVISKGEHPWIGYPDALGHAINQTKNKYLKAKDTKNQQLIYDRIHKSPYRQSSLTEKVIPTLVNASRKLSFLQSLHDIEANDLRDYIRPFFGNVIKESLDSLDTEEWQDLLEHIDTHSRDKKGQRATAIIHDFINIDEVLGLLDGSPNVQFDLLRMMLGTSNHRGAMAEGFRCKEICEEMLNSGFKPPEVKLQKFNNLLPGLRDNMFDFDESFDEIPEYSSKMIDTEIHNLGTIAQSLGLTGNQDNREVAVKIEENLSNHGDDRRHISRHSILLSELLIEQDEITRAHEILEELKYDSQNSFWFAAILKCVTLGKTPLPSKESFMKDMMELLDDDHPSQRIAHWYARWAIEFGEQNQENTKKCTSHLLSLTQVPLFSHDAPGVILACELKDLESRGYELNFDTEEFFEMVKANSQPSTLEWLQKHPPNEDDWLAPLNFNYR
jgi:hypothetical protein